MILFGIRTLATVLELERICLLGKDARRELWFRGSHDVRRRVGGIERLYCGMTVHKRNRTAPHLPPESPHSLRTKELPEMHVGKRAGMIFQGCPGIRGCREVIWALGPPGKRRSVD